MSFTDNTYKVLFYSILFLVLSILLFTANSLSISYKEALNVFVNTSLLSIITNSSIYIFGQNDLALRAPFILFYFLSVLLMYYLTEDFFKKESDRFICIILFMILPGLLSASILVNSAIIVTFFTLLYIYNFEKTKKHSYLLLVLFLFVDNSFAILFFALFLYGLKTKDKVLIFITIVLFSLSMGIYGFETNGKPRGFLVDTFAIYASIFSPLLFIYFFYSIYRSGIKNDRGIVWYIATTSLIFSLLFSFRQKIDIEDYAPFVVIFLPYMVKIFFHTVRIRLPQFRYRHYYITLIVLVFLFLNVLITIVNKPIYLILENPKKHFIYKYDFVKELASKLKEQGINEIESDEKELLLRLRFYGIKEGDKYFVSMNDTCNYNIKIPIVYLGKTIVSGYIVKN